MNNHNTPPSASEPSEFEPSGLNDPSVAAPIAPEPAEDIVSVNKKGATANNRLGKGIFILVVGSLLVGVLSWFGQNWLNNKKADLRKSSAPRTAEDTSNIFNPEKTGARYPKPKLGAESGHPPPGDNQRVAFLPGKKADDCVRPLRGKDGKVMINPQGQALSVDCDGNIITVPAITVMADEAAGKKPLPGQQQTQGQGGTQVAQKEPSRYGGSLFVGEPAKASTSPIPSSSASQGATPDNDAYIKALKGLMGGVAQGQAQPSPGMPGEHSGDNGKPERAEPRVGTVGSALYSSSTPVALARRSGNQNMILPKGRQADCVLTGRIVDEVPGFTSCVLAQDLYSANGRVLLLERGSELTGEYGTSNQLGTTRLFVTWSRIKTPHGIEVDLASPGADKLGTSGVPGYLDNRWMERIGSALLISIVKDISVAVINSQTKSNSGGTNVNVGGLGQNTATTSGQLAEEVIKETLKVRPRLTINQGERISIYVARDLDFTPVYTLRESGSIGVAKVGRE